MNFHVESSLGFQFSTKVVIVNLQTSLRPRHSTKKHGTRFKVYACHLALCQQSFKVFPLSIFFYVQFSTTLSIVQPGYEGAIFVVIC